MREVSLVVVSGPLCGAVEGFSEYLAGLGYAPSSIALRLRLLAHLSRWLEGERLSPSDFDASAVERFLVVRRATHQDLSGRGTLAPLLTFLRLSKLVPEAVSLVGASDPVGVVLEGWASYLARERGLQARTIRYYTELGRPFVVSRLRTDGVDFASLTAGDVSAFVSARVPGLPAGTAKLTIAAVRSLLRFLHASGQVNVRLDGVVPARAGYRDSGLPHGLAPEQVAALLTACDPDTSIGRRDRAVVVVLARLGLRAIEVARISLDDISWREGTIRVRGKGGYVDTVPLPVDVGEVLAAYLSQARPATASDRLVFLRFRAPYRGLSAAGVTGVVGSAGIRAGLGHVGAHQLRHSVATATINAGASLEEVAQLLRHRSQSSTTIYAKVDLTRLKAVVRPWPLAAARTPAPAGSQR